MRPIRFPETSAIFWFLTGVPTSESYSLRFRADSAAVASPQLAPPDSHIVAPAVEQTNPTLSLTATAITAPGSGQTYYTLEPVADSSVASGNPNNNYGTQTSMYVMGSTVDAFKNERSWLKFDLSSLPSGTAITNATLHLYCWSVQGSPLPASLHGGTTDSWTETGINWSNQPTFGSALDTQTLSSVNSWYVWDATSFVQNEIAGDKTVSLVVKAVTEDSPATTAPKFIFDAKEYSSNHPFLQVVASSTGSTVTVAQVRFWYRYSADGLTQWSAWTNFATVSSRPWNASFTYPNGVGYYEFYSVATDSNGAVEPAPAFADASVHYSLGGAISVEQPAGTTLANGASTVDFGTVAVNKNTSRSFVVRNTGTLDLTNLQSAINETNSPSVFSVGELPSVLSAGSTATFSITYSPVTTGSNTGTLQVTSSDPANNPFVVNLTGIGALSKLQQWRQSYFGTSNANGAASDTATPQNDGVPNLIKFATNMDPSKPGKMPGSLTQQGSQYQFTYTRNKDAVADGFLYVVEWTDDLTNPNGWSSTGIQESATDQGATELVNVTIPATSVVHRFVRMRIVVNP